LKSDVDSSINKSPCSIVAKYAALSRFAKSNNFAGNNQGNFRNNILEKLKVQER
jgi:hypothetical protein